MKSADNIPINNIYYLLCYVWNGLEEGKTIAVNTEDSHTLFDLFSRVIINGTTYLFKKGLERDYITQNNVVAGIKGKLDMATTLKKGILPKGYTHCSFDEFSYNTIHNRILKSSILHLLKIEDLDKKLKKQLFRLYQRFHGVENIVLSKAIFSKIQLHRNNKYYALLLQVCRLIYDNSFVNEEDGKSYFSDFIRDDRKMNSLFESFVKRFYQTEKDKEYRVSSPKIKWQLIADDAISDAHIPSMRTDIVLEHRNLTRKIIIDTKFYKDALAHYYDTNKARSAHLYQIFAYLLNSEDGSELNDCSEGMLLYPEVKQRLRLEYSYKKHRIRICTVDLNQSWEGIEEELLGLL